MKSPFFSLMTSRFPHKNIHPNDTPAMTSTSMISDVAFPSTKTWDCFLNTQKQVGKEWPKTRSYEWSGQDRFQT